MVSKTVTDGFSVDIDVKEWAAKDDSMEDWRFPIAFIEKAATQAEAGTKITITEFSDDIKALMANPTLRSKLGRAISQTYSVLIGNNLEVSLNHTKLVGTPIPLGASDAFEISRDLYTDDGVQITIIAGLAARDEQDRWGMERAGWYVLCNGRVVLSADKSEVTGWGGQILPQFHSSKHRGFVGIVAFVAKDPLKLPWTTTKRNLNQEAQVFIHARLRMATVARPVTTFLDSLYSSESQSTEEDRDVVKSVGQADMKAELKANAETVFKIKASTKKKQGTTKVQYDADDLDLALIRRHLNLPGMYAYEIGLHTFGYFMEQEGLR